MRLLVLTLLLSSCSYFKRGNKSENKSGIITEAMASKARLYCSLSRSAYDTRGWVVDRCDGAGFTSLYKLACPENNVNLDVFQGESGSMHRDPEHKCFITPNHPDNGSAAGFSKDHVLMRMIAAYELKDLAWLKSFLAFVDKNNGQFCDGNDAAITLSRCYISVGLHKALSDSIKKIDGEAISDTPTGLRLNDEDSSDATALKSSFEAHLDVQFIRFRGMLYGGVTGSELSRLKGYAQRETKNALYQSVAHIYGQASAESVLFAFGQTDHWPDASLPNNRDNHCDTYIFSRDMIKNGSPNTVDWGPCPDRAFEEYSGTDYSFALHVLSKK